MLLRVDRDVAYRHSLEASHVEHLALERRGLLGAVRERRISSSRSNGNRGPNRLSSAVASVSPSRCATPIRVECTGSHACTGGRGRGGCRSRQVPRSRRARGGRHRAELDRAVAAENEQRPRVSERRLDAARGLPNDPGHRFEILRPRAGRVGPPAPHGGVPEVGNLDPLAAELVDEASPAQRRGRLLLARREGAGARRHANHRDCVTHLTNYTNDARRSDRRLCAPLLGSGRGEPRENPPPPSAPLSPRVEVLTKLVFARASTYATIDARSELVRMPHCPRRELRLQGASSVRTNVVQSNQNIRPLAAAA